MRNKSLVNRFVQKTTRQLLRNNPTKAEQLLWQELRGEKLGVKFIRQYGIEKYIVDFCCRDKKFIIEIDGSIHDISEVCENDQVRAERLEELGYKIMRFSNNDIIVNISKVLNEIKQNL